MKRNTILLLDDDFANYIGSLSIGAKNNNLQIIGENEVQKGLEVLNENELSIGAVLLDLSFTPGNFEGIVALEKIKMMNPLIPVIILTGSDSAKDISVAVNCMSKGAFNYVLKTNLNPQSLFELLKAAIKHYEINIENKRRVELKEVFTKKVNSYNKMLQTTTMILKNTLEGQIMFPPTFEMRLKDFDSFYNKLLQKEIKEGTISDPFERLNDIAGMRAIFYNTTDLEKAVEMLKNTDDFVTLSNENKLIPDDKRNTFGYRAVHFDVKINPDKRVHLKEYQGIENIPCEIQLKTIFAHSWSKVHHAFSYKKSGKIITNQEIQKKLNKDSANAAKKLEEIENQINMLCNNYNNNLTDKTTNNH